MHITQLSRTCYMHIRDHCRLRPIFDYKTKCTIVYSKLDFCNSLFYSIRGVQYVHCVMHKCIMVKLGGNETHVKYVKKYVNFTKSEGKF